MEIVLRPVILFVFLLIAWGISRLLHRFIPEGKVKRMLYKRHRLIPEVPDRR